MAGAKLFAKEDRRKGENVDLPFLALTLLLLTVGLVVLYSASSAQSAYDTRYAITTRYLQKQAVCALLGLGAMYGFSRIPDKVWYHAAWPLYFISIALLLSVLIVGQEVNGAKRWINIAGLQFQPSEVAKFAMIVLLARLTQNFGEKTRFFRWGVLGFGGALLGILVPLALEKHLSAIMLMGMVAVLMMYPAVRRADHAAQPGQCAAAGTRRRLHPADGQCGTGAGGLQFPAQCPARAAHPDPAGFFPAV